VTVRAPAKVNPTLRVLGRRADGLHAVVTTLLALDRCDRIEVERVARTGAAEHVRLSLGGESLTPDVPADASNLAARAAEAVRALALERDLAVEDDLEVRLEKRVPSRAGLGGGSSDAAAVALATATLLGLSPDDPELVRELATLGADVPFFLVARASGWALCTGRGEEVEPLAPPQTDRALVVLTPAAAVATGDVYAALEPGELGGDPPAREELELWCRAPLDQARAALVNDLEAPALRAHPALARIRGDLDTLGAAHLRLAGSGSSFFGLFSDAGSARDFLGSEVVSRIARDHGLRAAFVARPGRHGATL
jgi:4-diphosphocytidyl-2-C-methyl-D-erythritol kinase